MVVIWLAIEKVVVGVVNVGCGYGLSCGGGGVGCESCMI